jgi:hypothetical protein
MQMRHLQETLRVESTSAHDSALPVPLDAVTISQTFFVSRVFLEEAMCDCDGRVRDLYMRVWSKNKGSILMLGLLVGINVTCCIHTTLYQAQQAIVQAYAPMKPKSKALESPVERHHRSHGCF